MVPTGMDISHGHYPNTMIKGRDVIGLNVITVEHGRTIHDVDELIYDPFDDRVVALVVEPGGWFSNAKIILFKDIKVIGKDAVLIESEEVVRNASDVRCAIQRIENGNNYLNATRVVTEDGIDLGKVSDIYFDARDGRVHQLEVSQGSLKTLESTTKYIHVGDIITVGEDATIVKRYMKKRPRITDIS